VPDAPGADTEDVVARWIEAACLALTSQPDPVLARQVDELVDQFVRAQQPDGYVGAYHTVREPGKRFTNLRDMGELSAAGQILRAASAHHEATGEFRFLNVALRYVDLVGSVFGSGEHQKHGYPGYPGIETALVDHYRSTGERRYLELSRYFVHQRGQQPNYFELEAIDRGESLTDDAQRRLEWVQAHVPVWQQTTAVGHAGRAVSLYAAMVDVGIETDDATLIRAAEKLFESVSERRVYVTGGIGSSRENGAFTADFDLPNETADASTRSAIGLFEWLDRMSHLGTDSRYADLMERVLYNGILVGMSEDGRRFSDSNALKVRRPGGSAGGPERYRRAMLARQDAPAAMSRLLAGIGRYVYTESDHEIAIHHYLASSATFRVGSHDVTLIQETAYPWDGTVRVRVAVAEPAKFTLRLRRPGWCRDVGLHIGADPAKWVESRGYVRISRTWADGDELTFEMAMPVERVYAHPEVEADRGFVALQRGPVVFCFEEVDNGPLLDGLLLTRSAPIEASYDPDLLGGVVTLRATALREGIDDADDRRPVYSLAAPPRHEVAIRAVPYFAWDNRAPGEMSVWVREAG